MGSLNDSLQAQEKYNQLDTKHTAALKELQHLRGVLAWCKNLKDNIIPKKDRTIGPKQKEIDEYVQQILDLRKVVLLRVQMT